MTACSCGAKLPADCGFALGHYDAEQPGCLRDGAEPGAATRDGAFVLWASEVTRKRAEWVVPGRVPAGMLTLLAGDPKLGKSMLSMLWAAELASRGERSLMLTAEDSIEVTLKPRLEALRTDLGLIGWAMLRREGIDGGLSLPEDMAALEELVTAHEPRLVVVDPLMAHLSGRIDSHRDHQIRRALAPLHHLGDRHGCAVVVIVHLNKDEGQASVLGRVGGSIGLTAAARSVLLFARDPEDAEGERGRLRVLGHYACTLGDPAPSLRYEVSPILIPAAGTEPEVETAKLVEVGVCDLLASDLLRGPKPPTERDQARAFLLGQLSEAWERISETKERAENEGHAPRTLERAAKELEAEGLLERRQVAVGKPWEWRLSVSPPAGAGSGETVGGETGAAAVSPGVARRGETGRDAGSEASTPGSGETTDGSVSPPGPHAPRLWRDGAKSAQLTNTGTPPSDVMPGPSRTSPDRVPILGDEDFLPWLFERLKADLITEGEWHQASRAQRFLEQRRSAA